VARTLMQRAAAVGAAEHGNSAVLVSVAPDGELLDRRRIDLTRDLPTHPYHHEGSWAVGRYLNSPWARAISLADAVALVERVHVAAARGARESLEELAASLPVPIASIAIRVCPKLPPTTEERIIDTRAANVADSVMYGPGERGRGARLDGALVRPRASVSRRGGGGRPRGRQCFPVRDGSIDWATVAG
jgi:hypothetical protein